MLSKLPRLRFLLTRPNSVAFEAALTLERPTAVKLRRPWLPELPATFKVLAGKS